MTPVRIAPDAPVVYVDTVEAMIVLLEITGKRVVWRQRPVKEKRDE